MNNIWEKVTKWKFWLLLQSSLIIILYIIGNIRAGNAIDKIFGERALEALVGFIATIIAFPLGFYFLFTDQNPKSNNPLLVFGTAIIFYTLFFILVWYITKKKKYYKIIATVLFLFIIISFGGCSRIIEIPLIVT